MCQHNPYTDNPRGFTITASLFEIATGHPPIDDDLERCNCGYAKSELGHEHCGWNVQECMPNFMLPLYPNYRPVLVQDDDVPFEELFDY